jgi:deazaflavin-dependent oxidoreductase (nitroreductase family)
MGQPALQTEREDPGPRRARESGHAISLPERKRNLFTKSPNGGRTLSALMLPFFTARPPRGFGVLTTTGRRTGKTRRKCIHAIRRGEKAFIVMIRPRLEAIETGRVSAWVLNIRANPKVGLRMRGGTLTGTARELHDAAEIAEAADIYCTTINPFDYVECVFHRGGWPTRAKIEELHRSWFANGIALVVEFDSRGPASR